LALIFRYNYDVESLLNNIQYNYLIFLNLISIFLGLPLSIILSSIVLGIFALFGEETENDDDDSDSGSGGLMQPI